MTLEELQRLHMSQLIDSFGVANAESIIKDNKLARMEGVQQ